MTHLTETARRKLIDLAISAVFLPVDIGAMVVLTGAQHVINRTVWGDEQ
ncbi:hypothetical protein [Nocardia africana]